MSFVQTTQLFEKTRSDLIFGFLSALLFAGLTGLSAFIVIPLPFTPVPITAQTLVVLLSGVFLGRKYGPLSQFLYIALGIIGIPWFANQTAGIDILLGATGGYLVGFVLASFITGSIVDISEETRKLPAIVYSLSLSTISVYITGILGLMIVANLEFWQALQLGFFPFLPGDLFKIFIAVVFATLYLPREKTSIDTELSNSNKFVLMIIIFVLSLFLIAFIYYLLTAGDLPPSDLPLYSILVSLIVLPGILLIKKIQQ